MNFRRINDVDESQVIQIIWISTFTIPNLTPVSDEFKTPIAGNRTSPEIQLPVALFCEKKY